jgi:hypothetical protein
MSYFEKTKNAKEIEEAYEKFKGKKDKEEPQKPKPEEQPNKNLQKVGIKSASNNDAIDGLRSTSAQIGENRDLTITLRDTFENVAAVGLKFKGGPFKFKIGDNEFKSKVLKDTVEVFELGKKIKTDEIKVTAGEGGIDVITAEVFTDGQPVGTPVENPPAPGPAPAPPESPPSPPSTGDGPYPSIGEEMKSTQRGPTVRHYASGKPDDKTIEKNVKNIKYKNYQFLVDVKITTIEHDDTLSLKYGGTHMGSGWFDNTIDFKSGLVALGTEKKHPSAQLRIVKGDKIGSVLNKKIRMAGIYRTDENKCEMWTDLGDGWKKNVEGKDVNNFNPKSDVDEAQLRIDGFEDVPEITRAVVQPIA